MENKENIDIQKLWEEYLDCLSYPVPSYIDVFSSEDFISKFKNHCYSTICNHNPYNAFVFSHHY